MNSRERPCHVLLVCGSLREGSSNAAVIKTAQALAPSAAEVRIYEGQDRLPHFDPDLELGVLPAPAAELRAQLAWADAVLFSTPEYAGGLPGSFKNLLDWTVGEGLHCKPVGWINPSPHEHGAQRAYEQLRAVLGYVNADVVPAACVRAPVRRDGLSETRLVHDAALQQIIRGAVQALIEHVQAVRRISTRAAGVSGQLSN